MRKNPVTTKAPAEQVVKDIRRATRKLHSSGEKIQSFCRACEAKTANLDRIFFDCPLAAEPLAAQAAAGREQARCQTLYTYLADNIEPLADYGRAIEMDC